MLIQTFSILGKYQRTGQAKHSQHKRNKVSNVTGMLGTPLTLIYILKYIYLIYICTHWYRRMESLCELSLLFQLVLPTPRRLSQTADNMCQLVTRSSWFNT